MRVRSRNDDVPAVADLRKWAVDIGVDVPGTVAGRGRKSSLIDERDLVVAHVGIEGAFGRSPEPPVRKHLCLDDARVSPLNLVSRVERRGRGPPDFVPRGSSVLPTM